MNTEAPAAGTVVLMSPIVQNSTGAWCLATLTIDGLTFIPVVAGLASAQSMERFLAAHGLPGVKMIPSSLHLGDDATSAGEAATSDGDKEPEALTEPRVKPPKPN